jgi:hypothetical protein
MAITFKGLSGESYSFEGYYTLVDNLKENQGIYSILDNTDGKYYVKDVGESNNIKERIKTHDRKDCWTKNCKGIICIAVMYTPDKTQEQRCAIESDIRGLYKPVCGVK